METVLRVAILYLVILAGLRIIGKREFGQLSPLELITLLLVPELVSQAALRADYSLTNGLIALTTLLSLVFITSLLSHRFKRVETLVSGRPAILVANGKLLVDNLNRERVSTDEIYSEMHKSGLARLQDVKWALLETDGRIAIIPVGDRPTNNSSSDESRAH